MAALIGLGDQPQVQEELLRLICETHRNTNSQLIVPSFQMRRGHPWLVAFPFWTELLDMKSADLDTPEDYFSANL